MGKKHCYLAYLTYMQSTSYEIVGWMTHKLESKFLEATSDMQDDTTPMAESEEELKSFLMNMEEESEKAGLKLNIQKAKVIASSPITSWRVVGETMETVTDFIFLSFKIILDSGCSHGIERQLLLERKAMTNLTY